MAAEYALATGVQGLALDTGIDLAHATAQLPPTLATQGNIDPAALVAGGPALDHEVDAALRAVRGRPHIVNLGHGIVPHTSLDHVAQLLARVRAA